MAVFLALTSLSPSLVAPAQAASGDRTLYLYYTHTKETARITFKRNGRYDQKGLAQLNRFLRDWRRNEPAKMDPALFDLVWEVYQQVGASQPIHVVSAYRAPETNEMLRSRSNGVAKNSRHTMGMAMDFFIPGVSLSRLREAAMRVQVGGVGYYPTSGSPFVHLDTGNVRAWPRMTRAQLQKLFPDGKTLHLPTDGVPLSQEGRKYAQVQWQKCHAVPCSGRASSSTSTRVAAASGNSDGGRGTTLMDLFFGGDEDEGNEAATVAVASASASAQRNAAPATAPVPMARPAILQTTSPVEPASVPDDAAIAVASLDAPVPMARPASLFAAAPEQPTSSEDAVLAIAALEEAPRPRTLLTREQKARADALVTAYAPPMAQSPEAQRALEMLIERAEAGAAPLGSGEVQDRAQPRLNADAIRTASLGGAKLGPDTIGTVLGTALAAVQNRSTPATPMLPAGILNRLEAREGELIAPDLEHVADIFTDPDPMSSTRYAVIFEHDEADFDPKTELGRHSGKMAFSPDVGLTLDPTRFSRNMPLLVATR